jgi:hypothetical protein
MTCLWRRILWISMLAAFVILGCRAEALAQAASTTDTEAKQAPSIPPGPCAPRTTRSFVPPSETLSAIFYYPWHIGSPECPADSRWCNCIWFGKPGDPRAALGLYDSSDQSVVDTHMDWLVQHGINVVAVSWTGVGTPEEGNFLNHVLPAIEARSLKFVVLYEFGIRFNDIGLSFNNPTVHNRFVADFQRFAASNRFFQHPKYLRFRDKPVIYFYGSRAVSENQPYNEETLGNIQQAFEQADQVAGGVYLVADHLFWGDTNYQNQSFEKLRRMSPSAVSSFGPVDPDRVPPVEEGNTIIKAWADAMAAQLYQGSLGRLRNLGRIDLTPGVFVQYDDYSVSSTNTQCGVLPPRDGQAYHLTSGADWSYMLATAGMGQRWVAEDIRENAQCDTTVQTNSDYKSIVWTYSFNEWAEGAGVEPLETRAPPFTYPYGFGFEMLERLRDGMGASGGSEPPDAPVPNWPHGTAEGVRPLFSWNGVQFASAYQVKAFDANGTEVVGATIPQTRFRPGDPGLAGNQVHTWKVRARNVNGVWSAWSPTLTFTPVPVYTDPPSAPRPLGPSGCVYSLRPTFTWEPAERAQDYLVAVYEIATDRWPIYDPAPGTSFVPNVDLRPGFQYRWKVKARNSAGETWSDPQYPMLYFTPCGSSLSISDVTVSEETGSAAFVVYLSPPSTATVTVSYATRNGTALAGSDYGVAFGTLTFAPGVTSQTVSVSVTNDTQDESHETFFIDLTDPVSAGLSDSLGIATIVDDDPPAVSIADCSLVEGNQGSAPCSFVVSLSSASAVPVTVNFTVAGDTATQNRDYFWPGEGTQGYVTFATGTTVASIALPFMADLESEDNEVLWVDLWTPTNATLGRTRGVGTILDDEATKFYTVTACRLLDTRQPSGGPIVSAGERRTFAVTGTCGVPHSAKAIAMNVTTLAQSGPGSVRLCPTGLATPPTSNGNFVANHSRSNSGLTLLGTAGRVTVQCDMEPGGQTHVVVDVFGYYK